VQRAREEAFIRREQPSADGRNHPGAVPARAPKGSKVLVEREGGVTRRRLQVYLDPRTADALKQYCKAHGTEMSVFVDEAIRSMLRERRRR